MNNRQNNPQPYGRIRGLLQFSILFLLVFFAGLLLLVIKGKAGSFLWLNSYHSPAADRLFIYLTFLGDGLFAVALSVCCFALLRKRLLGVQLLLSYLISGAIAQVFKHLVVAPRPSGFFAPGEYRFFIQDITHTASNSFPSGHATTALALATTLALFSRQRLRQSGFLLLGWLAAYSRVFLAQHFLIDILIGGLIGYCVSVMVCLFFERNTGRWLWLAEAKNVG